MNWEHFRPIALWILKGPRSLLVPTDPKGMGQWYDKRLAIRRVVGRNHTCTTIAIFVKAQSLPHDPPAIVRSASCDVHSSRPATKSDSETITIRHALCSQEEYNRLCSLFAELRQVAVATLLTHQEATRCQGDGDYVVVPSVRELDVASLLFAMREFISIEGVFVGCYLEIESLLNQIAEASNSVLDRSSFEVIERYEVEPWGDIWDVKSDDLADFPNRLMGEEA